VELHNCVEMEEVVCLAFRVKKQLKRKGGKKSSSNLILQVGRRGIRERKGGVSSGSSNNVF